MSNDVTTFAPSGGTAVIAATTVSGSAVLPFGSAAAGNNIRVYNDGPSLVFIKIGTGTVTASVTSIPLPVGAVEVLSKGANDTVAAVTLSATANVYVTPGNGN